MKKFVLLATMLASQWCFADLDPNLLKKLNESATRLHQAQDFSPTQQKWNCILSDSAGDEGKAVLDFFSVGPNTYCTTTWNGTSLTKALLAENPDFQRIELDDEVSLLMKSDSNGLVGEILIKGNMNSWLVSLIVNGQKIAGYITCTAQ